MLAELIELVIGVDTTHTAAPVAVNTRALLATFTVSADPDGYARLVDLAEQHGGLRAWAIEGPGGYGAGPGPSPRSTRGTGRRARPPGPSRSTRNMIDIAAPGASRRGRHRCRAHRLVPSRALPL